METQSAPRNRTPLQKFCVIFSVALIVIGLAGLVMSCIFLGMAVGHEIAAGSGGVVASAILLSAGVISLSILSRRDA